MLAYTIASVIESGVFDSFIVSTDSEDIAKISRHYGAEVPFLRPTKFAGDTSPDIEWLEYTLTELRQKDRTWDCFGLLRPTSPFRKAETVERGFNLRLKKRLTLYEQLKNVPSILERCGFLVTTACFHYCLLIRENSLGIVRLIKLYHQSMCKTRLWR